MAVVAEVVGIEGGVIPLLQIGVGAKNLNNKTYQTQWLIGQTGLRATAAFIETMIERRIDSASRPRYADWIEAADKAAAPISPSAWTSDRSLTGTFRPIAVPRGIIGEDAQDGGGGRANRCGLSAAHETTEALIAGAYLSGTNTPSLLSISKRCRQKSAWQGETVRSIWNARSLKDERSSRLILDGRSCAFG